MKKKENIFIPGTEWLYYKFYTGFKTSDRLLAGMIKTLSEKLLEKKINDRWFFIRYADPDFHLRVRFHMADNKGFDNILRQVSKFVKPCIDSGEIYRVQIDTYQREVSRYGKLTMDFSERVFFYDSVMVTVYLEKYIKDIDHYDRWLFALKAIDSLLGTFGLSIAEKLGLLRELNLVLSRQHHKDRQLAQQISKKYRKELKSIDSVLAGEVEEYNHIIGLRDKEISKMIRKMKGSKEYKMLEMRKKDLLASYIHMMMNRIFSSHQGQHEMVIYDMLFRYYKSGMAKNEYRKGS